MLDTDMARYLIRGRSPGIVAKMSAMAPAALCVSAVTCVELI